jgi:hypothetical protein
MSWYRTQGPKPGDCLSCDAIETVIVPRSRDIGGFEVRRALPSAQRQMVGPFIFSTRWARRIPMGTGMDVRPHPHKAWRYYRRSEDQGALRCGTTYLIRHYLHVEGKLHSV